MEEHSIHTAGIDVSKARLVILPCTDTRSAGDFPTAAPAMPDPRVAELAESLRIVEQIEDDIARLKARQEGRLTKLGFVRRGGMAQPLLPDALWAKVASLLPQPKPRSLGSFLSRDRGAPQHQELLRLIASLVEVEPAQQPALEEMAPAP